MFLELIYGLHYWYLIWFSIVCLFVIIMLIIPSRFFYIISDSYVCKIYLSFGVLSLIMFFVTIK